MCGLVGVYGQLTNRMEGLFTDLWRVDQLRGIDGAGVAVVPVKKSKPDILKSLGGPDVLMDTKDWKDMMKNHNVLIMGHNRAATTGLVNDANCHPFKHGHITLTHNGTLVGKHRLDDAQDFPTDSEAITFNINKNGAEETYKILDGAATMVWWDAKYQTLCMASNGKRPFHYTYSEKKETLIWASELWMIRELCKRKKIVLYKDEIYKVTEHQLYTFKFNQKDKVISFVGKELEEFKHPTYQGSVYYSGYSRGRNNKTTPIMDQQFDFVSRGYGAFGYDEWDAWDQFKEPLNIEKGDNVINLNQKTEGDDPVWEKEFTTQGMSLADFRSNYKICMICRNRLWSDYATAVILSDHEACCASCASIGTQSGVRMK